MSKKKTIRIKNMCCGRCIIVVTDVLKGLGLQLESVKLGEATFHEVPIIGYKDRSAFIDKALKEKGFELIVDEQEVLMETIKITVIENINNLHRDHRESDLIKLLEKNTHKTYRQLNTIFVQHKKMTIDKYIILQRIEKVKSLIDEGILNFSEIADAMGYKAPQHLSGQFKRVTGITMNGYKTSKNKNRKHIDEI